MRGPIGLSLFAGAALNVAVFSGCGANLASVDEVPFEDARIGEHEALRVSVARVIDVPGSDLQLAVWEGLGPARDEGAFAIRKAGRDFGPAKRTRLELVYRNERQDPALLPPLGDSSASLHIVQFYGPALPQFLASLEAQGAEAIHPFPHHAYVMRLPGQVLAATRATAFVRAVVPFTGNRRIDLGSGSGAGPQRYFVLPSSQRPETKSALAAELTALGAQVRQASLDHFALQATMTLAQVRQAAELADVLHIDPWSPPESDMDKARIISGADFLEEKLGFNGSGVRGEVMDGNVDDTHPDLKNRGILFHGPHSSDASHGTCTTGIIFGDGSANRAARGLLPAGQPIFADYDNFQEGVGRTAHTAELKATPYEAVFQSNSWGSARTTTYTTVSAQMDSMIFDLDFLIFNSQSNSGNRESRPEAWAKNVVSIGGVKHYDTLDTADDKWARGGSIGPASDGRIKPDLAHFWDQTLAPAEGGGYEQFGGTSGATPITAGYAGLFLEMWSAGLFGNATPGATVFENRPHFTTAKAVLVNTATQWAFSGAAHDLTRTHQGWGRVDIKRLYELRNSLLVVDETDVLAQGESRLYPVTIAPGTPELRATLTWADPAALPSAGIHRINDLTLKVTAPDGTFYFGNNGLNEGMLSTPGGSANTIDTLENVLLANPAPGLWTIEVRADEVAQDSHRETPQVDVDYALVVSGIEKTAANQPPAVEITSPSAKATVSGRIDIQASATDADGTVTKVRFGFPDGTFVDDETAPFAAAFDTGTVANGPAQFTAVATDDRGASSQVAAVDVTIANVRCADGQLNATGLPLAIPDNNPAGISVPLTVEGSGAIVQASVSLVIKHTYRGDLWVRLTSPSGQTVDISRFQGRGADDLVVTDAVLSGFSGAAAGTWLLSVSDEDALDVGKLESFSLKVKTDCGS